MKEFDRNLMSHAKRYPHFQFEEHSLREICLEYLSTEYGANIPAEVEERLEKELATIDACELSGVMLILHKLILRSGLKRYELLPDGTLGASLVAWLCGLTMLNPLTTLLPFYPEFCYGYHWNKELHIAFSVPTGKADELFGILKGIEGVGDVIPVNGNEGCSKRIIVPDGEEQRDDCSYFTVTITELDHLRLLKQLSDSTRTDPEEISFEDHDVFELFQHSDHPSCIEISPFRLTAIGLMGLQYQYELEFYGNVNIELDSFIDLVRICSLVNSSGAWEGNQSRWIYKYGAPLSALMTCREDVYEYCQKQFGFSCDEAYIAAETIKKGDGFPYKLRGCYWSYENMPVRFRSFCENVSYLSTRVNSYCLMALAWRCAWYRLYYPIDFYRAYFKTVADPQVAEAVFAGRDSYLKLAPHEYDEEYCGHDDKFRYNIDLAVAEEMYLRGIDLSNVYRGAVPDGIIRLQDSLETHLSPIKKLMADFILRMDSIESANPNPHHVIYSGLEPLDKLTTGFHAPDFIILSARPGVGITEFGLQIAYHAATKEKRRVAFFSMSGKYPEIARLLVSAESGVNVGRIRRYEITEREHGRLVEAAAAVSRSGLFLTDEISGDIFDLYRAVKEAGNIALVIIDDLSYLQTISPSEYRETVVIASQLKIMAQKLNAVVIGLTQLKPPETDSFLRPSLSEMGEWQDASRYADLIMFLHREAFTEETDFDHFDYNNREIIVPKNINGETGSVRLTYDDEHGRFTI